MVLVVADDDLIATDRGDQLAIGLHATEVGAEARAAEDSDRAGDVLGHLAGVLQRVPGAFQEHAALRVQRLRFARGDAEKRRVEHLCVVDRRAGVDEARQLHHCGIEPGRGDFGVGERADRLDASAEVAPELLDIACRRPAAAHADDRDRAERLVR